MENAKQEAEERYPEYQNNKFAQISKLQRKSYIKGHESCHRKFTEKLKGLNVYAFDKVSFEGIEFKGAKGGYILVSDIEKILK